MDFLADFDDSGTVDDVDLGIWQTGFGSGTQHSEGDADGDGDVDGNDFLVWQREFAPESNVDSIPEPSTLLLFLLGVVTIGMATRRRG